jgi:8-oxo-dGTP pyrophosphatase MutT (NUDIX family)
MATAIARDAASLIIYRKTTSSWEVLMGKRRKQATFAPGVYVFPGGGLDATDTIPRAPAVLNIADIGKTARHNIHALANAAIRETWEETGLLLAERGKLDRTEHSSWEFFRTQGLIPASQHLHYLGRAITPARAPIRFHARFFVSDYEHFAGSLIDEGELLDLRWVNLDETLSLPMVDVTEFMLEELQRFFLTTSTRTPVLTYRQNRTLIRYE